MERADILVVGETPSLGRSLRDLLESGSHRTRYTEDPTEAMGVRAVAGAPSVVIVACNGLECETVRRWLDRGFPGASLLVVGARDPSRFAARGVRGVALPIDPRQFLELVEGMLETSRPSTVAPGPPVRPPEPTVGVPARLPPAHRHPDAPRG